MSDTQQERRDAAPLDVFEAMGSARAMRRLSDAPVPEALVERLVWAATRASSPENTQAWDFVIVREPATKRALRDAISGGLEALLAPLASAPASRAERRMREDSLQLVRGLDRVPVLILVCGRRVYPEDFYVWSAVYPASQNLIVAARALGLGCVFTTFQSIAEPEVRRILAIPDDVCIGTLIPVGWPTQPFGPVRRKPVDQVIHRERW